MPIILCFTFTAVLINSNINEDFMKKIIAVLLIILGAMLLGWSVWSVFNHPTQYKINILKPSEEIIRITEKLKLPAASLHEIKIYSSTSRNKLAIGVVLKNDSEITPIYWHNEVTVPFLFHEISPDDLSIVLEAIRAHVPDKALILSWWDLSRAIRLISKKSAPLDDQLARGLFIPDSLSNKLVEEANRWGATTPKYLSDMFTIFIDALTSKEPEAFTLLNNITHGQPAYIVVHISDVWKIANIQSDKMSMGFKDFPSAGLSHGVIKSAIEWMRVNKIEGGYAAEPIGGAIRVHYFINKSDSERLIAQLLPFSTSILGNLKNFKLVYQFKGYWIYEIASGN